MTSQQTSHQTSRREVGSGSILERAIILHSAAQQAKTRLAEALPACTPEQRDLLISQTLTSLYQLQLKLNVSNEAPAAVTDLGGNLLELSVGASILSSDPGNRSVCDCMRRAALALDVFQFDGKDVSLHTLGSPDRFDGSAAVYNFGPSRVVLTDSPEFQPSATVLPVREDYWSEAAAKRNISLTLLTPSAPEVMTAGAPGNQSPTDLLQPPSPLRIEQPGFLRALYDKWEGRAFDIADEGLLARSQDLLDELMGDLHQASFDNIATGGGPFSAAIIAPNGKVIAFGVNRVVPGKDALAHGEVSAYREALANARVTEEYRDIEDLSGFILVTSSMTCVSCAEKMAEYGIKVMYFSNTAADIEGNTPFTEGPVRADFSTLTGTRAIQVPAEEDVRLAGFREFCRVIQFDPARSYLEDRSRDGKGASDKP